MLVAVIAVPLAAAVLSALAGWRQWVGWLGAVGAVAITAAGVWIAVQVLGHGPIVELDGLLRADALSAFWILVIGLVAVLATWFGVGSITAELADGYTTAAGARLYAVLVQLFLAAMVLAVVANNLGIMWVAVEATTIATAFLVGHRRTPASLEASWKYVVVGSVGVALAFLGTVLVYFASSHALGAGHATLNWTALVANAHRLDPRVIRLAAGLLVLGFGTKVGLAPMHTWLPDAHSQAPAPVSALMSGVLLSVAFYALLRYKVVVDVALGRGYMKGLLVAFGLLSLAVAASLLIAQRDYKRLLAYSSIEHMGLIAVGTAAGSPLAIAAVLLQVLGHGLGKASLFLSSGEILHSEGTTGIAGVHGLLARRPVLGATFGVGLVALLGLPPFSLFASEVGIARAGVAGGLGWAIAIAFMLMLVVFAAVVVHGQRMLLGDGRDDTGPHPVSFATAAAPIAGLVVCAALGVTIWPIENLLHAAAAVVVGPH